MMLKTSKTLQLSFKMDNHFQDCSWYAAERLITMSSTTNAKAIALGNQRGLETQENICASNQVFKINTSGL